LIRIYVQTSNLKNDEKYSYVVIQRTVNSKVKKMLAAKGGKESSYNSTNLVADPWLLPLKAGELPAVSVSSENEEHQETGRHDPTPLEIFRRFNELEIQLDEYNRQLEEAQAADQEDVTKRKRSKKPKNTDDEMPVTQEDLDSGRVSEEDFKAMFDFGDGKRAPKPEIVEYEDDVLDVRREKHPVLQNFLNGLVKEVGHAVCTVCWCHPLNCCYETG
jgi:uncharacterized membrane protein